MKCRICYNSSFKEVLDLGRTPPADSFLTAQQVKEAETSYPLNVVQCEVCGLTQLDYVVPPDVLYCHDYPYEAYTTLKGRQHWEDFAENVVRDFSLKAEDLVIDIGSNVGELLFHFKENGTKVLGVDPASNIVRIAQDRGIDTVDAFFCKTVAESILAKYGNASVITGTNVFAHVDDLHNLLAGVKLLLSKQGVFIFQSPHFMHLIEYLGYDTIYHEHLSYLSLYPVTRLFDMFGLEVFRVEEHDIHGGSFRVFVARKNEYAIEPSVDQMLQKEKRLGIYSDATLRKFSQKVKNNKLALLTLLCQLKQQGKSIVAISAPAKGMTLLNYCGIDTLFLDYVTEKSKLKIGRFTPGTHIPVVPDGKLFEQIPDYALLLAWNFEAEIRRNLIGYANMGGKYIIPVPEPIVV